jgi:UDP-N-acetylmuramate dehydrogenase
MVSMQLLNNLHLSNYSTMGLGGIVKYLIEVKNHEELEEAIVWAKTQGLPIIVIGSGSNVVWKDEGFNGLLIVNSITGYEVFEEDETTSYITVGAGEIWDSVVERSVEAGLSGIEALSLIPGKAGATPIQNVGAYGQEISNTLTSIIAYDLEAGTLVTIPASDCNFAYRTSRFKTTDKGRFIIVSITLHLMKGEMQPPFYGALQTHLLANNVTDHSPATIRQSVIDIRSSKLPDPNKIHNSGSFFGNPIVPEYTYINLANNYENIPHWSAGENKVKLSAAWLIEQAGFKDFHDNITGMGIWPLQSLVLVNETAKSTAGLIAFRNVIIEKVKEMFNVELQQEPELLP